MTTLASLVREGSEHKINAASIPYPSGSVRLSEEGNVIVFMGQKAAIVGDPAAFDNQEVFAFTKGAIAFAVGDTAYFDGTDIQKTGFIRIGRVTETAATGDATVNVRLMKDARGVTYVQTAAGTALTNSTVATNLGVAPNIPANVLRVGDKLKIRAQVVATATNSTDTLQLNAQLTPVTSGSAVNVGATAAVDVANGDMGYFEFEIVIRTIGVTGTMVASGTQGLGTPGTVTAKPFFMASTVIDTTQPQTIGIQGTWSAANAGDSCRLDVLNAELIRA